LPVKQAACGVRMDTNPPFTIAQGREHEVVASFARFLGAHGGDAEAVREVSCDMSPAFIKGVRDHLPNAEVTFDKFHVSKILSDALKRVRRSE
jgi:transposase